LQNSKNTLRQAQGERYRDYSIHVEPVEQPFPFVVSLSNHNSYFCKRLYYFLILLQWHIEPYDQRNQKRLALISFGKLSKRKKLKNQR